MMKEEKKNEHEFVDAKTEGAPRSKMRLYFNNLMGEWIATRRGVIIAHSTGLDLCIDLAVNYIIKVKKGFYLSRSSPLLA